MGNRIDHLQDGFPIGIVESVGYLLERYNKNNRLIAENFITSIIGVGVCLLGSIIPDGIEPPNLPNHRKCFHSKCFGGIISGLTFSKIATDANINS